MSMSALFRGGFSGIYHRLWALSGSMQQGPKIFIIGFNKTATSSLHQFFERNRLPGVHWDHSHLVQCFERNIRDGKRLLSGGRVQARNFVRPSAYEDRTVFSDMTNPHTDQDPKDFNKRLDSDYPGSKFILNTRDAESWIRSRFKHEQGHFVRKQLKFYGLDDSGTGREKLKSIYRKMHEEHHRDVLDHFRDREDDLVVFDILKDDIQKVVDFFEGIYVLKTRRYPHVGRTRR